MPETLVKVDASFAAYNIHIGAGLLGRAGETLKSVLASKKLCVVTDAHVARHYLIPFMHALEAAGFTPAPPIILPAGEETKNFAQLQGIIDKCLSYKLDRKSALVALGGGVVGDITGFAASVILRGIPFVQVPTSLLAQVDSSVGGKTGINTAQGKNLVGAFYQPKAVLIDTDTLKTLPLRELKAGYAEILKYALIDSPDFFAWLQENGKKLLAGDAAALTYAIEFSCRAKAAIVAADEKEQKDIRALLNLGHTFGHALEALGGYDGRLLHGEAVGIGLKLAFAFSGEAGLCPAEDAGAVNAHLAQAGLMQEPPFEVSAGEMLARMKGDKKAKDGKMTFVLARGIGRSFVANGVDEGQVAEFLRRQYGA
ncbi:MAG TPA: 3-dehydroquinate synthase [Patescibacteria group bacterium]|nr:3-dehydroquinate synthase [Patescibacteria group bacterium]